MSYNGSGTFNLYTPGNPVVTGTTISSTWANNTLTDIATGLSTAITKDGQTTITANIPMAGFKFTGLGAGTANGNSIRYEQWTNNADIGLCEFRLTGTTDVPVTTSDVTAIETLYWTPYKGNRVALFDGSSTWTIYNSAELSVDIPDATNCYDVFVYANAGVPELELTAWTNETTRATALTTQNGVLVKTGATTRRFLGTFYCTTAGNGQTEDSYTKRWIWNYYNRVARPMRRLESTDSWNYTTASFQQANASAANQLDLVIGVSEDAVEAMVRAAVSNTNASVTIAVGIGLDATNANATGVIAPQSVIPAANQYANPQASWKGFPGVGRHYLAWLEYSSATGTSTWIGDAGVPAVIQSGIYGSVFG